MGNTQTLRPVTAWVWLVLFALVVAFLGGSSRPDIPQIAVLRPLAALFLIPALYTLSFADLGRAKLLVWLTGMLAVWMAIQLIPLPPSVWQSLPGREAVSNLDRILAIDDTWRPISLVPSRGWNALASLIVPLTALLLALAMRAKARMLLILVAGLGALDAMLGLLQVMGSQSSPLYYYAITNRGSPVGIFANENHSAAFSAVALLVIAYLGLTSREQREKAWLRLAYAPLFAVVLLSIVVSGSRAGFALGSLALVVSCIMAWLAITQQEQTRNTGKVQTWLVEHPKLVLGAFVATIVVVLGAFVGMDRASGFDDTFSQNAFEDLRWSLFPVLQQMAGTYWGLGIGFGSFEEAYHIFEPTSVLMASYVNQAHNDWLQLVIEGGLPAIVMLGLLLLWVAKSLISMIGGPGKDAKRLLMFGFAFAIIAGSSLVDYPLRAPAFQAIAVWLLLSLSQFVVQSQLQAQPLSRPSEY